MHVYLVVARHTVRYHGSYPMLSLSLDVSMRRAHDMTSVWGVL